MKYWVTSDTHFGHYACIDGWGNRGVGFEDKILDSIRRNVKKGDVVINLGDFAWYKHKMWTTKYREACREAKSWLIKGNHDKQSNSWWLDSGFDFVGESFMMERHGKRILFTHKPQPASDFYDINVHGHLHTTGHRDIEYQAIKHDGQLLIEIETSFEIKNLDKLIRKKIQEMK